MRVLLILLTLFLVVGCNQSPEKYHPSREARKREARVDVILKNVANKLRKMDLHPIGSGGGTSDGVRMLALSFTYNKEMEIEEGRELLTMAIDVFLEEVNSDEQIRPYLKNYPFEPKNIEVHIYLQREGQTEPPLGNLTVLSAIDGNLEYIIEDPKTKHLRTIYEETYEEALRRPTDSKLLPSQPPKKMKTDGSMANRIRIQM